MPTPFHPKADERFAIRSRQLKVALDDKEHLVGPGTDISSLSASVATGASEVNGLWSASTSVHQRVHRLGQRCSAEGHPDIALLASPKNHRGRACVAHRPYRRGYRRRWSQTALGPQWPVARWPHVKRSEEILGRGLPNLAWRALERGGHNEPRRSLQSCGLSRTRFPCDPLDRCSEPDRFLWGT